MKHVAGVLTLEAVEVTAIANASFATGAGTASGTNTGDQDLSALAPKASPTFTGTVGGITATMVGLGNVNNTSDAGKPVSTAQQTALDLKANLISPVFTTPNIGVATGSVSGSSGSTTGSSASCTGNAATVTTNANLTGDVTSSGNATTIGAGKVTQAMFANDGAAATSATTGTMTVNMTSSVVTITPTGACTFNASGGATGKRLTFYVTTSGVSSFVLTFGTNFRSVGTLATGTTTAKVFTVSFVCKDGTTWAETGRTTAM